MKKRKFIVVERRNDSSHTAYAKAPGDVAKIAARCGFEEFYLSGHKDGSRLNGRWQRINYYFKCVINGFNVPRGSLFLVQHPMDGLFIGKYGLCRLCFRELAYKGALPGVKKAS